jgi:hypothetical protein
MAPGQANTAAAFRPSSFTSPKCPWSMRNPTTARQLPLLGKALNWHGQPQLQLHVDSSVALIRQST